MSKHYGRTFMRSMREPRVSMRNAITLWWRNLIHLRWYWYLLTQIEYEGFRKRTEFHCSILPKVFQVSLFIFYHRKIME
jgi:hypothetical protein